MNDYKYRVLIIEDEMEQLKAIKDIIERSNSLKPFIGEVETRLVNSEEGALKVAEEIAEQSPKWNIIVADLFMPTPEKGGCLIANKLIECLKNDPELPVRLILISNKEEAGGRLREYLPKYRNWIDWYPKHKITPKDYQRDDLADRGIWVYAIAEAIKKLFHDSQLETPYGIEDLEVGLSGKMRIAKTEAEKMAREATDKTNILIRGDTGTGKEVFAKFIHRMSPFKNGPFIKVNCAASPDTLIESELFGYKKGAFSEAYRDKKGKFDDAQNGVIFLDEIGEISPNVQGKLLRVLGETREYSPLGGEKRDEKNFKGIVICATSQPIEKKQNGTSSQFREDLYYRISVNVIHLSPLKERIDDIIPLANHFIEELSQEKNQAPKPLSLDAERLLQTYNWPGNVRELKFKIEKALSLSDMNGLTPGDFPDLVKELTHSKGVIEGQENIALYSPEEFVLRLKGKSKKDLQQAGLTEQEITSKIIAGMKSLRKKRSMVKIANIIGWTREHLYERLKEFGVNIKDIQG